MHHSKHFEWERPSKKFGELLEMAEIHNGGKIMKSETKVYPVRYLFLLKFDYSMLFFYLWEVADKACMKKKDSTP